MRVMVTIVIDYDSATVASTAQLAKDLEKSLHKAIEDGVLNVCGSVIDAYALETEAPLHVSGDGT